MTRSTAEAQLARFIAKYNPEIAREARAILKKMRARLPGAIELVYDNYNALAIGFGPTERASDLVFSITLYPRWVSLFFVHGVDLPDPQKLLHGHGRSIRHIHLEKPETLDAPGVKALMTKALDGAAKRIDRKQPNRIVIKSVSPKQRPRRPSA